MRGPPRALPSVRAFYPSGPCRGAPLTHGGRTHGGVAQIDSELCETMEEAAMLRDQLVLEHRGAKTTHRLNFPEQREGKTPAVRARSSQLHLTRTPLAINHPNGFMPSARLVCRRWCEDQQRAMGRADG